GVRGLAGDRGGPSFSRCELRRLYQSPAAGVDRPGTWTGQRWRPVECGPGGAGTRRPICRASRHGLPVSVPTHDSARRVDPAEMTRKLRPYDQPPKRRRTLIPGAPDSAAGLFLVVAILWLLAAAGLGFLAAGARLFPDLLKVSFSVPLGSGIEVDITR